LQISSTKKAVRALATSAPRLAPRRQGWSFPPLAEARARWVRTYGPVKWHNPVAEWEAAPKPAPKDLLSLVIEGGASIRPVAEAPQAPPPVVASPLRRKPDGRRV
jgi:hypothetical protein